MRERVVETAWSLVVFTLSAQAAAGVAIAGNVFPSERLAPMLALALLALGGLVVLLHLGRPSRAGLTIANLNTSALSREVLFGLAFVASLIAWLLVRHDLAVQVAGWVAGGLGLAFVYSIAGVYRLRTVPAWDSWTTPAAFLGSMLVLGSSLWALALSIHGHGDEARAMAAAAASAVALQLLVALFVPTKPGRVRAGRFFTALVGGGLMAAITHPGILAIATGLLVTSEVLCRYLFYAAHRRVGL